MKKAVLIGGIVAGLLLILLVLGLINKNRKFNDHIDFVVETNPQALHEWGYKIEDESVAKYVTNYLLSEEKNIGKEVEETNDEKQPNPNLPIKIKYRFAGVSKGKTKITIYYYNVITNEVAYEKTFKVKVASTRSISLDK